jgi:hypothetical protein
MMIATWISQNAANASHLEPSTSAQAGQAAARKRVQRESADPGLDAEPAAGHHGA